MWGAGQESKWGRSRWRRPGGRGWVVPVGWGGPKGVGPNLEKMGPEGVVPMECGGRRVEPKQNFSFFFLSRPPFDVFSPIFEVFHGIAVVSARFHH